MLRAHQMQGVVAQTPQPGDQEIPAKPLDQPEVDPGRETPELPPRDPDEVPPSKPRQPEITPDEPEQPEITPPQPNTPEVGEGSPMARD